MLTIATERLVLRELQLADITDDYVGWLTDPEVARFLETRHSAQTRQSVEAFVAGVLAKNDEFLFGMFLDGRHIGNIKVGPIHPIHAVGDVSLLIGARDCWGKGLATEAIEAVTRLAFAELKARKLSASMYEANAGSTKAFLKAGYRQEGVRRQHYALDGERSDIILLGALPEDFR